MLSGADVRRALPPAQAMAAMAEAFEALCAGRVSSPERTHLSVPAHAGSNLLMGAYVSAEDPAHESLAVKIVSLYAHNAARGLARVQAAVLVLDAATGVPLALLDGAVLTALRTAAASALATALLARPESRVLALFGAGVQARAHLEAICDVRPIETVYCYTRTRERAEALPSTLPATVLAGRRFIVAASPAAALAHADVVAATTNATTPVFRDAELAPGVHVNAIGAYTPDTREIPQETVVRATVVVDSRAAAWQEAGDLILPWQAGLISREHVQAELGEILLGAKPGRRDTREVTLFKSVGVAAQDAVAARHALAAARRLGLGQDTDL
jgi:alanine dehydrogenase